jgi:hypothetical protein
LCCIGFGETDPGLLSVREFYASKFKGALNYIESCTSRLAYARLQLMDCHDPHARVLGKLLLAPSEQSACCSALSRRKHSTSVPHGK